MKMLFKNLLPLAMLATSALAVVNINTATKEELMSLDGIGASKAQAIIEHRQTKEFKSIEDLKEVKGIGDKNYEKIKSDISVSAETKIQKSAKQSKNTDKPKKDKQKDTKKSDEKAKGKPVKE